jgi:hypothetical protein
MKTLFYMKGVHVLNDMSRAVTNPRSLIRIHAVRYQFLYL